MPASYIISDETQANYQTIPVDAWGYGVTRKGPPETNGCPFRHKNIALTHSSIGSEETFLSLPGING